MRYANQILSLNDSNKVLVVQFFYETFLRVAQVSEKLDQYKFFASLFV